MSPATQGRRNAKLFTEAVGRRARLAGVLIASILGVALVAGCPADKANETPVHPAIVLDPPSLVTAENGGHVELSVALSIAPASQVDVLLSVSDVTEGLLSAPGVASLAETAMLHFGPADWNVPQIVQVAPQDDTQRDGNQLYSITVGVSTTTDATYANVPDCAIQVTNTDDEGPGFTLSKATASTSESSGSDTFIVRLNAPPSATVTIPVEVSDVSEGLVSGGSSPKTPLARITLSFTTANWNVPQSVTVIGQDDVIDDGNQTYSVSVGSPGGAAEYAALSAQTVAVTNLDDDAAGITNTVASVPLLTSEGGITATFTVQLNTEPIADVTVPVVSGNSAEGLLSAVPRTASPR